MMKKLAKLTALLAVAAFLLAGFPACSSDDDDGDPTLDKIEIKVDESEVKTTYTVGEDFDRTGITVTATYSDGSTKDVSDEAKYEATCNGTEFTTATAGDFEVTLTATYGGKTDSVTCPIKVKAGSTTDPTLTGIKITVDESKVKTTYTVGEDFDRTGITVTATYSDGSTKDVSDEAKYEATCDGAAFTTATAGDFEVTLTATYGGKTDSVTCPIKVKAGGISGGGNEGENQGGDGNGGTGGEETPDNPNGQFTPITVFDGSTMTQITDLPSCVTCIDPNTKQSVDKNSKSLNGKTFSYRFKFGGTDDTDDHSKNALKISTGTTSAVKVVVYAMCSNSSNTGSIKASGSGDAVTLLTNGGSALAASEELSVTPDSDGNIYIWAADNAMNVYYLYISQ